MRKMTPPDSARHEPAARLISWFFFSSHTPGVLICLLPPFCSQAPLESQLSAVFVFISTSESDTARTLSEAVYPTESRLYRQLRFKLWWRRKAHKLSIRKLWFGLLQEQFLQLDLETLVVTFGLGSDPRWRTSANAVWDGLVKPWRERNRNSWFCYSQSKEDEMEGQIFSHWYRNIWHRSSWNSSHPGGLFTGLFSNATSLWSQGKRGQQNSCGYKYSSISRPTLTRMGVLRKNERFNTHGGRELEKKRKKKDNDGVSCLQLGLIIAWALLHNVE